MSPIKKKVLLLEVLRLVIPIVILGAIFTGRIPPLLAGKVPGIAGLMFGVYFLNRALVQKEHSNVLLRLRGDDRRIPTTKWHRAMNVILAIGRIVSVNATIRSAVLGTRVRGESEPWFACLFANMVRWQSLF
jgi:hypothetical protein